LLRAQCKTFNAGIEGGFAGDLFIRHSAHLYRHRKMRNFIVTEQSGELKAHFKFLEIEIVGQLTILISKTFTAPFISMEQRFALHIRTPDIFPFI
jgi:hypothetical protein